MIKLTEITRKGDIISAHVTLCEGDFSSFNIVVNIKTGDIISCDREMDMFVSQARAKLVKVGMYSTEKTTPKSVTSVWY